MVFSSPMRWPKEDCIFLEKALLEQKEKPKEYPFTEADEKKLKTSKIRISSKKEVSVTVPDNEENGKEETQLVSENEKRESIIIQAKLAEIGEKLGLKIWLPRNDRGKVLEIWQPKKESLLEELPLVFDETTLKTIRNIDEDYD